MGPGEPPPALLFSIAPAAHFALQGRASYPLHVTFFNKLLRVSVSSLSLQVCPHPPVAPSWVQQGQLLGKRGGGAHSLLSLTGVSPATGAVGKCWGGENVPKEENWSLNMALMPSTICFSSAGEAPLGSPLPAPAVRWLLSHNVARWCKSDSNTAGSYFVKCRSSTE